MDFATWEPVYEAILADFRYDRVADEQARDELGDLLAGADTAPLPDGAFEGETIAIAGAAAVLEAEVDTVVAADAVVAASDAARRLREAGIDLDFMVTDLDASPETAGDLTHEGTPVAVHAHGDNREALREHVPSFDTASVIPTTQSRPAPPVVNPGGFTDGDRAAFLADRLGAETLVFPGWNFADQSVDAEKARKLTWAKRLVYWLERRRGDAFALLDGHREDLELPPGVPAGREESS